MSNLLEFDPTRFWNLIKLEATTKNKRALLILGAILGLLLLYQMWLGWNNDNDAYNFINTSFGTLLLIGGLIYTSYSFLEFSDSSTSMTYLTLPASNFEKFLSKWLFSTLGLYLFLLAAYGFFALIGIGIFKAIFPMQVESFNPFGETNWLLTKVYFVISSLFLVGAITFKSYHAPKTILTLSILLSDLIIFLVKDILMFIKSPN